MRESSISTNGLIKWGSIGLALIAGGYWGYVDTEHHLATSAAYMRLHYGWVCATGWEQQRMLGTLTWGVGVALVVLAMWSAIARLRAKS
jgi:hypothetical protein